MTGSSPIPHEAGPRFRDQIRRGVDWVALVSGALAAVIQLLWLTRGVTALGVAGVLAAAAFAVFGVLGLRGHAGSSPLGYVGVLVVVNAYSVATLGPLLGMGAVYILAIVLAFMCMSPIWRWISIAVSAVTPVVVGLLFTEGVLGPTPAFAIDDPRAWIRILVIGMGAIVGTAVIISFAVRWLVNARRELERVLLKDREARLARTQLELEIARARRSDLIVELAAEVGANIGAALAIVSNRAEALSQVLDDEARACLAGVIAASANARSTMRSLTVFAPDAAGPYARCDAAQTVRSLPQMVRRTIPERIAFSIEVPAALEVWVSLSATDLLRILANLVLNARDAIADTGAIGVRVGRHARHLTIEVTDDGSGMDADTMARLFQPFFTTKPIGRGTGLGLATAKILVERAGGELEVSSELGRGTRFTILLPEVSAPGAEAANRSGELPTPDPY